MPDQPTLDPATAWRSDAYDRALELDQLAGTYTPIVDLETADQEDDR